MNTAQFAVPAEKTRPVTRSRQHPNYSSSVKPAGNLFRRVPDDYALSQGKLFTIIRPLGSLPPDYFGSCILGLLCCQGP